MFVIPNPQILVYLLKRYNGYVASFSNVRCFLAYKNWAIVEIVLNKINCWNEKE